MSSSLHTLTLTQALDGLRAKQFTARELQAGVLDSIAAQNDQLNVMRDFHKQPSDESFGGDLQGVPLVVKDNYLTTDLITTASAKVLDGYRPAYESTVTKKLRQQGAYILGKTNMDAWAHGSSTETSDYGPTKNPQNPQYMPGGSSGGSAAAVSANMTIAALGTETAGSNRQPAAWCGVVGMKPTYGRVSRYGIVAMGSSLDSPGPITKTVEDAALLLTHMAGQDAHDGTTSPREVPDFTQEIGRSVKGMKIGFVYLDAPGLSEDVLAVYENQVFAELKALGAEVERVPIAPFANAQVPQDGILDPQKAIALYAVLQRAEVSSNLARYDGIRYGQGREMFGDEAKRRIMIGTYTLSKGYAERIFVHGQKVRTLYRQNYDALFQKYDVLVSPSAPGYALPLGESAKYPYFGELMDMLLEPSSIAGLPGISVPCYRDPATNLTLGLNIMAPFWEEGRLFRLGHAYERSTEWNRWTGTGKGAK